MSDYVIPEIKATEAEMISIRHYLHANPELSLEEDGRHLMVEILLKNRM